MNIKQTTKYRFISSYTKKIGLLILTCITLNSHAIDSNHSSLIPENMQEIMSSMQAIQECMGGIDHNEVAALQIKASEVKANISKHCENNNIQKAKEEAIGFTKILQTSQSLKYMEHCITDFPDMIKGHIENIDVEQLKAQFSEKDICSGLRSSK